jgi:hypothetical protein
LTEYIDFLARDAVIVDQDYFQREQSGHDQPTTYIAGPVPEALVRTVEQRLEVQFPNEYRTFLTRHGAMIAQGFEIAGLTPYQIIGQPFFRNVEEDTEQYVRNTGDPSDHRYVYLSSDGMGVDFLLDTGETDRIRIVARGPGIDDIFIAEGLGEFCKNMAKDSYAARLNAEF